MANEVIYYFGGSAISKHRKYFKPRILILFGKFRFKKLHTYAFNINNVIILRHIGGVFKEKVMKYLMLCTSQFIILSLVTSVQHRKVLFEVVQQKQHQYS